MPQKYLLPLFAALLLSVGALLYRAAQPVTVDLGTIEHTQPRPVPNPGDVAMMRALSLAVDGATSANQFRVRWRGQSGPLAYRVIALYDRPTTQLMVWGRGEKSWARPPHWRLIAAYQGVSPQGLRQLAAVGGTSADLVHHGATTLTGDGATPVTPSQDVPFK